MICNDTQLLKKKIISMKYNVLIKDGTIVCNVTKSFNFMKWISPTVLSLN